jgi:hypothetical protein
MRQNRMVAIRNGIQIWTAMVRAPRSGPTMSAMPEVASMTENAVVLALLALDWVSS